ncbi:MAG: sigma factor-like helix-turn-helix DNA-binding protein [Solirubrobacteraceae bacterium]|nr:sigma factor-like helix-turn-helix DNA-binding protein [Solirubrobacteraceae bacterium]
MAGLADLQPDRRAVLQLLVGRGRGYDQIAELLQLSEMVVRRRAHDAITVLAGGRGDIDDVQRALLCDYLVGELPASRRAEARTLLADDAAARRWARGAAARLSAIPGAQLPELPAEDEEVAEALDALDQRRERKVELEKESKLGAWLVVAGIAVAVIAAVAILAFYVGNKDDDAGTTIGSGDTPTETAEPTSSTDAKPIIGADLAPPSGGGGPAGQAVLQESEQGPIKLALNATGLQPPRALDDGRGTDYAFWMDGPDVDPLYLGFYNTEDSAEARTNLSKGNIKLGALLDGGSAPAVDAKTLEKYTRIFITRETVSGQQKPSKPGTVVLTGQLEGVRA